jgi:two-component system nitrogen regulation sensor histidine kinase NtrY
MNNRDTLQMRLRQFKVQLGLRLAGLLVILLLLAFGIAGDIRNFLLFCLAFTAVLLAVSLVRFVNHTNHELESFLTGLKFGDFQQTYSIAHLGPSFQALEKSLHDTVHRFKSLRVEKEQQAIYNQTLVQHIPIPLFTVHTDRRVEILNKATRRAFNVADINNTDELVNFGAIFQRDVLQIKPGEALLTTIEFSGTLEHFIMSATQLRSRGTTQKLISLQNVQSQIDATELSTWQNLLRVTSHEIINSLVPVSSCAQAAKTLVDDVIQSGIDDDSLVEDLCDIQESLATVLRRSEGLTRFIQSYRQLSRLPPPEKTKIIVSKYFQHLKTLVRDELARKEIRFEFNCQPESLVLMADKDMLDQVFINLIRNASDALVETPEANIRLSAYIDNKQRTVLVVSDNGPGIPGDFAEKIFMPFFTTRNKGSGIGLALVRYIMLSHDGTALYEPNDSNGSTFRLIF